MSPMPPDPLPPGPVVPEPIPVPSDPAAIVTRALGYPYARPKRSYLFTGGNAHPLAALGRHHLAGRTPVLAYGSNAAPEQLARKFADQPDSTIPVLMGRLAGFDIVYSCHITAYGALPATLVESPGTVVAVAVTWLNDHQLARMNETEGVAARYDYVTMDKIDLELELVGALPEVGAYAGLYGHLPAPGDADVADEPVRRQPIALAAIPATGRRFTALDQRAALLHAMQCLGEQGEVEDFIVRVVGEPAFRKKCIQRLRAPLGRDPIGDGSRLE